MLSLRPFKFALLGASLLLSSLAGAQGRDFVPGMDEVFLTTKIGSFKILPTGKDLPQGKLSISFTGTLLITGADHKPTVSGNLKKEYESEKFNKVVYHGVGKIELDGQFQSVQWFGRDMSADFKALGNRSAVIRLYGEFDKQLDTGYYWYAASPKDKVDWGTIGRPVIVPQPPSQRPIVPKVKTGG